MVAEIKSLPLNGIANSNDELAKHLRQQADYIDNGQHGELQNIYMIYERADGVLYRQTFGQRCDLARALGIITMAVAQSATGVE